MEKIYKVKIGATAIYINNYNGDNQTSKLISSLEGKKIFIHEVFQEENEIEISQYEKTQKIIIPVELLEEHFEEFKQDEIIKKGFKLKFRKEYLFILIGIIIGVSPIIFSNFFNGEKVIEENNIENELKIYTERILLLEDNIDQELINQKQLRREIENSVNEVKNLQIEKEKILNKKIELAQ